MRKLHRLIALALVWACRLPGGLWPFGRGIHTAAAPAGSPSTVPSAVTSPEAAAERLQIFVQSKGLAIRAVERFCLVPCPSAAREPLL